MSLYFSWSTIASQLDMTIRVCFPKLNCVAGKNYMYKFYHVSFQASLYRFLSITLMVLTVSIVTELYYGMYLWKEKANLILCCNIFVLFVWAHVLCFSYTTQLASPTRIPKRLWSLWELDSESDSMQREYFCLNSYKPIGIGIGVGVGQCEIAISISA